MTVWNVNIFNLNSFAIFVQVSEIPSTIPTTMFVGGVVLYFTEKFGVCKWENLVSKFQFFELCTRPNPHFIKFTYMLE